MILLDNKNLVNFKHLRLKIKYILIKSLIQQNDFGLQLCLMFFPDVKNKTLIKNSFLDYIVLI